MNHAADINLIAMSLRAGTCEPAMQQAIAHKLHEIASKVWRIERALDEIAADAMESVQQPAVVVMFPGQRRAMTVGGELGA